MDSTDTVEMEVLDGLAKLEPSGLSNFNLNAMGRTMEAWMNVYNMHGSKKTQPFFHINQGTADTPQVEIIKDGYFALAFIENEDQVYSRDDLLPFIVDPRLVFKADTTLTDPKGFVDRKSDFETYLASKQTTTSRTPCAYAGAEVSIPPGGRVAITSIYGHAPDLNNFLDIITPKILSPRFTIRKFEKARNLVYNITSFVDTKTNNPVLDMYIQQDFLDNILRGGIPVNVGDKSNPKIIHSFSRIHGDLERDYNNFQIDTTFFSQGAGNFRDVNQNRRNDVVFLPILGDFNIRMFLSFVQADGYNPLTVAGTTFRLTCEQAKSVISKVLVPNSTLGTAQIMEKLLTATFRIGELFNNIKEKNVVLKVSPQDFLQLIMLVAKQEFAAQYPPTQNGFWADHWTYTLDLVDTYLYVFPDKEESLLYDAERVPFYMSPAIVNDRKHRYSLCDNPDEDGGRTICAYNSVCQWGSPTNCFPQDRISAMEQIYKSTGYMADSTGGGGVWQQDNAGRTVSVSVISKFLYLGALKFSTLDPLGMGVEYEGGHPGWNDALNGLPGLVGSGMPETFEMLRVLRYINASVSMYKRPLSVLTEFGEFLHGMDELLNNFFAKYPNGASDGDPNIESVEFDFWNTSNILRESYRGKIIGNFIGTYEEWPAKSLLSMLDKMILKTEAGIRRSVSMTPGGDTPTYFYFQADEYYTLPNDDNVPPPLEKKPFVLPASFKVHIVPLFLEGFTRHMKILKTTKSKQVVYEKTKASEIYDSNLQMFKISAPLHGNCVENIGRVMAFAPGWLEDESVWLHMSYKFYLEILRGGLYDIFFDEIATGLVPFMDPTKYGRSPVEAASFIVSSVFPDETLHGSSFLARLSGSTAEFLSMWVLMMSGQKPFYTDQNGKLCLQLLPILPGWMFNAADSTVSFRFLGHTNVTYHNPERVNTWTVSPKYGSLISDDGNTQMKDIPGALFVGNTVVNLIRSQKVATIDVFF